VVTAESFKETDQVEIINKDLHIATLDNKNADFEMELVIEQGRGYMPVESRENQKLEVGMIAVDAIFTPIKSVHFDVSNVRVGQFTNYDKLSFTMETDGSILGEDAMDIASHILVDHFSIMFKDGFGPSEIIAASEAAPETEAPVEAEEVVVGDDNEIVASTLSTRAKNALIKNGITSFKTLKAMTTDDVMNLSGLGEKSAKEIVEYLERN
jgi:DNA-directed RNA polymerase subunit alpha